MSNSNTTNPQNNEIVINEYDTNKLIDCKLSAAGFRVFYALKQFEVQKKKPKAHELMEITGTSKSTFYSAVAQIKELQIIPLWVFTDLRTGVPVQVEKKLRDKMHARLGGHIDLITVLGSIDLLTNVEVVQVAPVENWRKALAKVQVLAALFPNHSKRIHLFGLKDKLQNIDSIRKACESFGVHVTSEVA